MRRLAAAVFALTTVLTPCSSASGRTRTDIPTLSLSNVTGTGFTASLSDTSWYLDSCSGTATFPDGTVSLDGSLIGGYDSSDQVGYINAPVNELPSSINISCKAEDDGAYLGMKTVWRNRRYIKAAAHYSRKGGSCNIGSHYYATLTINCLNGGKGWVQWYVRTRKGDQIDSAWIQWNKLLSTTRPFFRYRHVRGGIVATLPVPAGRLLVVNSVSVVVSYRGTKATYGTVYRTVGGPYTVDVPACNSVSESYSGSGDAYEPSFTTCKQETLTWTWVNTNGDFPTGMFINDESQFQVLVDESQASSGSVTLPAGTHTLDITTIGDWTITVG
jgi:hypothetical protein